MLYTTNISTPIIMASALRWIRCCDSISMSKDNGHTNNITLSSMLLWLEFSTHINFFDTEDEIDGNWEQDLALSRMMRYIDIPTNIGVFLNIG